MTPLLLLLTALCLHIQLMVHKFNRTPLTCEVITYGALYKVRHAQCKPAAFISAGYPTEMKLRTRQDKQIMQSHTLCLERPTQTEASMRKTKREVLHNRNATQTDRKEFKALTTPHRIIFHSCISRFELSGRKNSFFKSQIFLQAVPHCEGRHGAGFPARYLLTKLLGQ